MGSAGTGSRYKGLDRGTVIAAALDLIDRHGVQGLTMRRLGQHLGVEAMSLYRHVAGREDVLEGVAAELLSDLHDRVDQQLSASWQGYLQVLAHDVRMIAVDHPSAFPLVASRHPAASWLRPPLRSLELVDGFLTTLRRHGFTDDQAASTYRAFSSFLLGNLLLEAAVRGADIAPPEVPLDEGGADIPNRDGRIDIRQYPAIARLQPLLSEDRSLEEFEISLETLLDRLEASLSQ